MVTAIIFFVIGLLTGFIFLGSIATSRQQSLWKAVQTAAYQNDTSLCRQMVEENF